MFRRGPLKRGHESALKARSRPYKAFDSDGLFLLVQPSGSLLWRFRYRKFGIERKLSLGSFPDVSLQQARKERDKALAQLVDDIDPVEEKRERRLKAELAAQTTFKLVAEEFIQKMEKEGKSPATIKKARWFLELLEDIGKRPIASITPHELLDALKRIERRGHHETANRLRSFAGRVFRYGFATLRTASPLRQRLIDDMTLHKIYASFAYIAWRDSLRLCLLPPKKETLGAELNERLVSRFAPTALNGGNWGALRTIRSPAGSNHRSRPTFRCSDDRLPPNAAAILAQPTTDRSRSTRGQGRQRVAPERWRRCARATRLPPPAPALRAFVLWDRRLQDH